MTGAGGGKREKKIVGEEGEVKSQREEEMGRVVNAQSEEGGAVLAGMIVSSMYEVLQDMDEVDGGPYSIGYGMFQG